MGPAQRVAESAVQLRAWAPAVRRMGDAGRVAIESSRATSEKQMAEYKEGRVRAALVNFGPYVQDSKDGEPKRKFGIIFRILEGDDESKTVTFDSFADSDQSKERIFKALKVLGYVVPTDGSNPNPMLQREKMVGREASIVIRRNERGYYEVPFVDAIGGGDGKWLEKKKMTETDEADFLESFASFARAKEGVTAAPATQKKAAPTPQRPAQQRPATSPKRVENPQTQGHDEEDSIPF